MSQSTAPESLSAASNELDFDPLEHKNHISRSNWFVVAVAEKQGGHAGQTQERDAEGRESIAET